MDDLATGFSTAHVNGLNQAGLVALRYGRSTWPLLGEDDDVLYYGEAATGHAGKGAQAFSLSSALRDEYLGPMRVQRFGSLSGSDSGSSHSAFFRGLRAAMLALFYASAAATAATQTNVLFIAIDDLRNDLGALGVAHARTPHLDALAASGRLFSHHYVHVPTCGASRAALLRGRRPSLQAHLHNHAIAATHMDWGDANLPAWFRRHGYRTLALGKVTHYPGGLTGRNWMEGLGELPGAWNRSWIPDTPWKHAQGIMHGLANGQPRVFGQSPAWEVFDGPDTAYPDAWIANEACAVLKELAGSGQPWFFAVGFFKPHLPFAAPKRYFDEHDPARVAAPAPESARRPDWSSGWHNSSELRNNYAHAGQDPATHAAYATQLRQAYAASVTYMDAQVGRVLATLRALGMESNTVVVAWSDHGFLLGEHAIWGKHCLYEAAMRSPLIIRQPGMAHPGRISAAVVETVDLFPTLTDLCGLPAPNGLDGQSLVPQLRDPTLASNRPAFGYWTGGQRTVRTVRWRLIERVGRDGAGAWIELFDYETDPGETRNHADTRPEVVEELRALLASRGEPAPSGRSEAPR